MTSSGLPPTLTASRDGDVALLMLSRPAKRNALNDETVLGLRRYFMDLPDDIGAVVIAGQGEHFCSGLDLGEMTEMGGIHNGVLHSQMWHRAFMEIQFGRIPVISVLHGAVVGGGLELAASTHIRIAEPSAYYDTERCGKNEVTGELGLQPDSIVLRQPPNP